MKKRNGFVSNSSSSSFIILNDETLIPEDIQYVKLTDKQKARLVVEGFIRNIDDDVFLTEFVSDSFDSHYQFYKNSDDPDAEKWEFKEGVMEYHNGGHGSPYDPDNYEEISDNVYLFDKEQIYINGQTIDDLEEELDNVVEEVKNVFNLTREKLKEEDEE